MLRTIAIIAAILVGSGYAVQSPLYAAAFYLWIAYFRPESWAWSSVFSTLNLSYFAGTFLLIRTLASSTPIRFDFRTSLLFVFLGHSLLSTALGPNPEYSLLFWQEFAKTIIVS